MSRIVVQLDGISQKELVEAAVELAEGSRFTTTGGGIAVDEETAWRLLSARRPGGALAPDTGDDATSEGDPAPAKAKAAPAKKTTTRGSKR